MNALKRKFILDCDAGTDDAQALMMALSEPSVELVAVLAVFGNASCENTARNCLRILKFKNRLDIPVYKGSTRSLIGTDPVCTNYHGKDGLGDIQIDGVDPVDINQLQEEPAAIALVRMVNENPGEITLVATGPLTNVALALHIDPELGTKLQDIYVMGGNTEGRGNVTAAAEFNFYSDPEAAYFVLNKLNKTVNLCSMEVCEKHGFSWEWYEKFTSEKTKASRLVHDFENGLVTREKQRGIAKSYIMVWDQVAMAVAINKELATETQDVYVTVELHGTQTRGQLIIDWRNKYKKVTNARIVRELNHKLFDHMMHLVIQD